MAKPEHHVNVMWDENEQVLKQRILNAIRTLKNMGAKNAYVHIL
jgi:hypothetical protein